MHADLLARRDDHPILATRTYLANHTLGAMHRASAQRLKAYADEWATDGVLSWPHWRTEVQRAGDLIGQVLGAPAGATVMRANVADAMATVASSGITGEVLIGDKEWPGTRYLWSQTPGVELRVVEQDRLAESITARTKLVVLSQVLFRTSTLTDAAPVVEAAHRHGALVVLDAYQAAGTVPLDVTALGVDVCVGGSVKWLCGGPGNGWVYVRPGSELRPGSVGWWGHATPFAFTDEWAAADGAMSWAGGTPNVAAAYAAIPAYEEVLEIGVERIRERSLSLTQPLVEAALERGWDVPSPHAAARRGGHVTLAVPDSERVHDRLVEQGFVVDHRPGAGLRVGPHWFNTAEEVEALIQALD